MRFKILATSIPLILAGIFARGEMMSGPQPCISLGETSVRLAWAPWQAQMHVGFTDDPVHATVRVQIVDSPETADFAVVDDIDDGGAANSCPSTAATRFVSVSAAPTASEPVVYLSQDGDADYRIFVRSKSFTSRDAAALIVGARGGHARMAAAAL